MPRFECIEEPRDTLDLSKGHQRIVFSAKEHDRDVVLTFFLSKQDAIRLAAEIQSWCETGEFIKPKKEFCVVYKPNCYPVNTRIVSAESAEQAAEEYEELDEGLTVLIGVLPMPEEK